MRRPYGCQVQCHLRCVFFANELFLDIRLVASRASRSGTHRELLVAELFLESQEGANEALDRRGQEVDARQSRQRMIVLVGAEIRLVHDLGLAVALA